MPIIRKSQSKHFNFLGVSVKRKSWCLFHSKNLMLRGRDIEQRLRSVPKHGTIPVSITNMHRILQVSPGVVPEQEPRVRCSQGQPYFSTFKKNHVYKCIKIKPVGLCTCKSE